MNWVKKTKQESLDLIEYHSSYWKQFQSGSQGISGKKTENAMSINPKEIL